MQAGNLRDQPLEVPLPVRRLSYFNAVIAFENIYKKGCPKSA